MVTHDPDIARQADRRIELAHGHLHFDTAQHGPGHPLAVPSRTRQIAARPFPLTTKSASTTSSNKFGFAARKARLRKPITFTRQVRREVCRW